MRRFTSNKKLLEIYWIYSLPIFVILWCLSGALLSLKYYTAALISAIFSALFLAFLCIWIPRFYNSIVFKVEDDHAYAKFGVWWKIIKRVPYALVSEIRIRQGPLQRKLGLANLDLFTPATGVIKPELTYFQIEERLAKKLQNEIRKKIGLLTPKERRYIEEEILEELKAIRRLLEEKF